MASMEVLNKIVKTEITARSIFDEAAMLRESFKNYVSEHIDSLRKQYFERADKHIAEAKERENLRAELAISNLDAKLKEELAEAKKRYENEKAEVVLKIFKLAVGFDA
jgi:type III secretory pathway component EscR